MTAVRAAVEAFGDDLEATYGDRLVDSLLFPHHGVADPWPIMTPVVEVAVVLTGVHRPGDFVAPLVEPVTTRVEADGLFVRALAVDGDDPASAEHRYLETVRDEGYSLDDPRISGEVPNRLDPDARDFDESTALLARSHLEATRTLLAHADPTLDPGEAFASVDDLDGPAWYARALHLVRRRNRADGWVGIAAAAGIGAAKAALNASGVEVWGDWHNLEEVVLWFEAVLGDDETLAADTVADLVRLRLMERQLSVLDAGIAIDGESPTPRFTTAVATDALAAAGSILEGITPLVETTLEAWGDRDGSAPRGP